MSEIYVSTDIESGGPICPDNPLLSFGSAAFKDFKLIDTFSANLEFLPESKMNPDTEIWWKTQPQAWAECRSNLQEPAVAMKNYLNWLNNLAGKVVFVGYPATFDFSFVYYYLMRFTGKSPFSFAALDIKTYAMAMIKKDYKSCTKKNFPRRWFGSVKHKHTALADAIEQGEMFMNMIRENTVSLRST